MAKGPWTTCVVQRPLTVPETILQDERVLRTTSLLVTLRLSLAQCRRICLSASHYVARFARVEQSQYPSWTGVAKRHLEAGVPVGLIVALGEVEPRNVSDVTDAQYHWFSAGDFVVDLVSCLSLHCYECTNGI